MKAEYMLALTTGLIGGFGHCLGMCGPLVASCSISATNSGKRFPSPAPHLLYNAGRITTYVFIGALMGITGTFTKTVQGFQWIQNLVVIISGILMIVMGLGITGTIKKISSIEKYNTLILKAVGSVVDSSSILRFYPLGLLLGFLPCGLSYSIFLGAAATGSLPSAMVFTLCFGLGTVPSLLIFGFAITYISHNLRNTLYKASGLFVIITGIYFLIKGVI